MSAWLLSIVGVVSLGVLIEIIMPEGEHSKYIKGIFSLIVVFVIVSPFPKLFSEGEFTGFSESESVQTEMDEISFEAIKEGYRQKVCEGFEKLLTDNGFQSLDYSLTYDKRYVLKCESIAITSFSSMSADKQDKLKQLIESYFGAIEVQSR